MQMVQMATGAIDSAGIPGSINSQSTAAGISMGLGAIIKRHKRTLINFQEQFLIPMIEKTAWRYMQFAPELYPVQDYKFVATSSLGIIAREYEVTQLVQLLQTMGQDSPMYGQLLEAIIDHMNLSNREDLIESLRKASQPNPQAQEAEQAQAQMQMQQMQAQIEAFKGQSAESQARAEKYRADSSIEQYEAETDRLKVLSSNLEPGDADEKEFQRRAKVAELVLKERELETKAQGTQNAEQPTRPNQQEIQQLREQFQQAQAGSGTSPQGSGNAEEA